MRTEQSTKDRVLGRLAAVTGRGSHDGPQDGPGPSRRWSLNRRVAELEREVQETRRLNQRLCDVVDVVTEILVPAADRDDERMRAALDRLNATLSNAPRLSGDDPDDDADDDPDS